MKNLILLAALTLLIGGHVAPVHAVDRPHTSPETSKSRPDPRHLRAVQTRHPFASQDRQAQRRATASAAITWVSCPQEAQDLGAMCGALPVPLDRRHPKGRKLNIYFEVYLHTNPGPAESAILTNFGGPGDGTTDLRALAVALFGQNLDAHDFLLIDDRGRGLSAAIDCEELQHGLADFAQAETECAAQLGDATSWYGTGDVAIDTDAVRAALGYDKVDYWGGSYGGEDVTAYATRFGQHLRSIILDAPQGTPGLQAFSLDGNSARATSREIRLGCQRSPTCAMDHPNPDAELDQLIQAIRSEPLQGNAFDADGTLIQVQLDEGALLFLAIFTTGHFVSTGELLAAGNSLSHGDPAPLLRLGAEAPVGGGGDSPLVTDFGDPTSFSAGAYLASMCVDADQPWDWSEPVDEREPQFAAAVANLPINHFAPFSKRAGTHLSVSLEKQCLWWQKPTPSEPVAPPNPTYPDVPTLVLDGDMDTIVPMEEVHKVAALFPGSTFVPVAEAGHVTGFETRCSAMLQSQFVQTLQVGDTSCTKVPETIWPALGRFPLHAADARPARVDPNEGNQSGEAERKVVTVAVATAIDALQRTTIGSGSGVGLRAGTFQTTYDADGNQITTLTNCAFAKDVTVTGAVVWRADLSFVADLAVSGTGTTGGNLHVEGAWQAPGPVGNFKITGTLGGRQVAVLVPEA